jgi:hypothetical protein
MAGLNCLQPPAGRRLGVVVLAKADLGSLELLLDVAVAVEVIRRLS